jgi:hypothetical protein
MSLRDNIGIWPQKSDWWIAIRPSGDGVVQIIWRCFGQRPELKKLEKLPLAANLEAGPRPKDNGDCHERVVAHEPPGRPLADGPFHYLKEAIFHYDVFPPEWVRGIIRGRIRPGDTVGICYRAFPGVDLFFGARVSTIFDETADECSRTGWTYQTLAGHPELGEDTFAVEKDRTGQVKVSLRSWSRPGFWLVRIVAPYLRLVQLRAGRAARDHLQRIARSVPLSH